MALRNSVNASLQRLTIYKAGVTHDQKRAFRETLKGWLKQLALRYYAWEYDEEKYFSEISALRNYLLAQHGDILAKMTIGVCQKSITLWLKYLWLSGDPSKKPIFATLDRGIMKSAKVPHPPNWSDIDTIDDYRRVVDHIDNHAKEKGFGSGAVWEAETWSDDIEHEEL